MMTRRIWQMGIDIEAEKDREAGLTPCPECSILVINRKRWLDRHAEECGEKR